MPPEVPRSFSCFRLLCLAGFLLFAATAWGAPGTTGLPTVKLDPTGISSSNECGLCHKDIYAGWKDSLHAQASDNPVFWTAYLRAFYKQGESAKRACLSCHAPVARINGDFELSNPLTRESINCDFCHSVSSVESDSQGYRYKHQFSLIKQGPLENVSSPVHQTRFNELYKQSLYCAGCHEYQAANGIPLIETFTEWKESSYPAKGTHCQDCHMRKKAGKVVDESVKLTSGQEISSHNIAGGHSLAMREQSLDIQIESVNTHKQRVQVNVALTNKGAGHKIPTGLPSKKIILEVSVKSKDGADLQVQRKVYQKLIVDRDQSPLSDDADLLLGYGDKVISDNRIKPQETVHESFTFFVSDIENHVVSAAVFYSHNPQVIQPAPIHLKMREVSQDLH